MKLANNQSSYNKLEILLFWGFLVQATVFCLFCVYLSLAEIPLWQYGIGKTPMLEPWVPWFALLSFLLLAWIGCINIWRRYKTDYAWEDSVVGIGIILSIVFIVGCVLDLKHGIGFSDFGFRYNLFMININLLFVAFVIKANTPPGTIIEGIDRNGRSWGRVTKGTPITAKVIFSIVVLSLFVELCFAFTLKGPDLLATIGGVLVLGLIAFVFIVASSSSHEDVSSESLLQIDPNTGMIEITEKNVDFCRNLDVVAFSVAAPGAGGEGGGVILVTRDNKVYHTNYCTRISETELICVARPYYYLYLNPELEPEKRACWHEEYLGMGNNLYVLNEYWGRFDEEARKRLKEYQEKGEFVILYNIWIEILQTVIGE